MTLTRSDLIALARKYQTLGELRRAQYQMTRTEVRAPLQRLSREFPGALREIDTLTLDEIDRRAFVLREAAETGHVERWMEWIQAYHLTMRAALGVKRRIGAQRTLDEHFARQIATSLRDEDGWECDLEFVHAVARPPQGRLNAVVFARLELRFGAARSEIARALFPEVAERQAACHVDRAERRVGRL